MTDLSLLPFKQEHFDLLGSWFRSQKEVTQWAGAGLTFPLTAGQLADMMEESRMSPARRQCWMVADNLQQIVGHAQLAFDWENGVARLARIAVAPQHRGNGLAGKVLAKVLSVAFDDPNIERAELNVFAWNANAIAAYRRIGFLQEGIRRSSVKVGSDRWDTMIMGLLRHEWEAKLTT